MLQPCVSRCSLRSLPKIICCITTTFNVRLQQQFMGRRIRHGQNQRGNPTKTYCSWRDMIQRCTNPKVEQYPRYGGRGIRVCEEWLIFDNFFADMGFRPTPAHSLNRINNDGNYEPSNCAWATAKEQARNRRNSRVFEMNGRKATIAEWVELTGINYPTLYYRLIISGWTTQETFTTPVK